MCEKRKGQKVKKKLSNQEKTKPKGRNECMQWKVYEKKKALVKKWRKLKIKKRDSKQEEEDTIKSGNKKSDRRI